MCESVHHAVGGVPLYLAVSLHHPHTFPLRAVHPILTSPPLSLSLSLPVSLARSLSLSLPPGVTGMGQVRVDPDADAMQKQLLREIAELQDESAHLSKLVTQVNGMASVIEAHPKAYVTHKDLQSLDVFNPKVSASSSSSSSSSSSGSSSSETQPHTVIAVKAPAGTQLELNYQRNMRNSGYPGYEAVLMAAKGASGIKAFLVQQPTVDPAKAKEMIPIPTVALNAPLDAAQRGSEVNGTSERLFGVKDLWPAGASKAGTGVRFFSSFPFCSVNAASCCATLPSSHALPSTSRVLLPPCVPPTRRALTALTPPPLPFSPHGTAGTRWRWVDGDAVGWAGDLWGSGPRDAGRLDRACTRLGRWDANDVPDTLVDVRRAARGGQRVDARRRSERREKPELFDELQHDVLAGRAHDPHARACTDSAVHTKSDELGGVGSQRTAAFLCQG